jgi:5-hydroxyisourate hydrolase-like protein (transthyretin family)
LDGPFFRSASASFRIEDAGRSYHVPLLLAPYSVASYLGS